MQVIYKITEDPYSSEDVQEVKYITKKGLISFYNKWLKDGKDNHAVVDDESLPYEPVPDFDTFFSLIRTHKVVIFGVEDDDGELLEGSYTDYHYEVEVICAEDAY